MSEPHATRADDGGARTISAAEAAQLLESGAGQVVDVRTPAEREAGRIPGSLHIELGRLDAEAATLDRSRPVVLYCRGGGRSAMAAEALAASGWDARSVDGGLLEWVESGRPLEPEGGSVAEQSGLPPR